MGARAAVVAGTEMLEAGVASGGPDAPAGGLRLVLVSYPLKGPKDDLRDQILLDLPSSARVLFVIGDKDAMCPLRLLEDARKRMKAETRLVVVRGADHGMHVKPAGMEKQLQEEAGRLAVGWVAGELSEQSVEIG